MRHIEFKACILPNATKDDGFHKQCAAEVNAVCLFFPNIWSESILTVFAAWLGFACVMDDTLETFSPAVVRGVLHECIDIMRPGAHESTSMHAGESFPGNIAFGVTTGMD